MSQLAGRRVARVQPKPEVDTTNELVDDLSQGLGVTFGDIDEVEKLEHTHDVQPFAPDEAPNVDELAKAAYLAEVAESQELNKQDTKQDTKRDAVVAGETYNLFARSVLGTATPRVTYHVDLAGKNDKLRLGLLTLSVRDIHYSRLAVVYKGKELGIVDADGEYTFELQVEPRQYSIDITLHELPVQKQLCVMYETIEVTDGVLNILGG